MDYLKEHDVIAKDKQLNYQSHSVYVEKVYASDGYHIGDIEQCKVCIQTGASLYDHKCTGLPPIPDFDELGVF